MGTFWCIEFSQHKKRSHKNIFFHISSRMILKTWRQAFFSSYFLFTDSSVLLFCWFEKWQTKRNQQRHSLSFFKWIIESICLYVARSGNAWSEWMGWGDRDGSKFKCTARYDSTPFTPQDWRKPSGGGKSANELKGIASDEDEANRMWAGAFAKHQKLISFNRNEIENPESYCSRQAARKMRRVESGTMSMATRRKYKQIE